MNRCFTRGRRFLSRAEASQILPYPRNFCTKRDVPNYSTSRSRKSVCFATKIIYTRHYATSRSNGKSERMYDSLPHKAYVALGSNIGNRVEMIEKACRMMERDKNIRISRTSNLYETEPMYVREQNTFVNGVCEVGSHIYIGSSSLRFVIPACYSMANLSLGIHAA